MNSFWEEDRNRAVPQVVKDGVQIATGSRVRLHPHPGGDIMDLALAGRSAIVEGIEEDLEGHVFIAVTVEDDPGRDLGEARQPGHRFFFTLPEIEPLDTASQVPP